MILCFGEILLRIQADLSSNSADLFVGGAEANVAASLAQWEADVQYVSRMPNHILADQVIDQLTSQKIDCAKMLRGGERIGSYYVAQGADMKSAAVVYDRKYSSFAMLQPNSVDWHAMLEGVCWLHWSAISPAISEIHPTVMNELLVAAKEKNIKISVDLNYRNKLWQYTEFPAEEMHPLVQHCDMIMGNLWAAESLLDVASPINESSGKTKFELIEAAEESMMQLQHQYPNATTIAYTFRLPETYFALLKQMDEVFVSKEFVLENIVDKIGTGDSFMAGLIFGSHNAWSNQQIVDFAAAAAVSKFSVRGDFNMTPLQRILQLAEISHSTD